MPTLPASPRRRVCDPPCESYVPRMTPLRIAAFTVLLFASAAQASPPVLKAKVEEPALQETMGGCSLKCAFGWTVEVQPVAGKARTIKALNDENAETAWVADAGASGVGVK